MDRKQIQQNDHATLRLLQQVLEVGKRSKKLTVRAFFTAYWHSLYLNMPAWPLALRLFLALEREQKQHEWGKRAMSMGRLLPVWQTLALLLLLRLSPVLAAWENIFQGNSVKDLSSGYYFGVVQGERGILKLSYGWLSAQRGSLAPDEDWALC